MYGTQTRPACCLAPDPKCLFAYSTISTLDQRRSKPNFVHKKSPCYLDDGVFVTEKIFSATERLEPYDPSCGG